MTPIGDHYISPHFKAGKVSPGRFEDWVDVYEDRVTDWLFDQADSLIAAGPAAWPATLALALSFIEGYEIFRTGEDSDRRSQQFFQAAFRRIFSHTAPVYPPQALDSTSGMIYRELRCGLFHLGLTGPNVFLGQFAAPLELVLEEKTLQPIEIHVDVPKFLDAVKAEFRTYTRRLRDPSDPEAATLKAAFERTWHRIHKR